MVAKPAADMQTLSYVWHLVAWVVFFWNGTIIISRYIISRPQVFTEGLLLEIFITSHLIFYFINKEFFFLFFKPLFWLGFTVAILVLKFFGISGEVLRKHHCNKHKPREV